MRYPNVYSLLQARVAEHRNRSVFYVREAGQWVGISWETFNTDVHQFASALLTAKLTPRHSVCILMGNITAWPVSDLGTIAAGGVSVGLYPTSSAEQCQYIINHADAEFVLVDTATQLQKILQIRNNLPQVKQIIVVDETLAQPEAGIISYREFLRQGEANLATTAPIFTAKASQADPEEIAIMVYTSGTTGQPKGACLSHRYIINSAESLLASTNMCSEDTSFSYLPYCHVAERISGLYNRLYLGAAAYFVDDVMQLWQYMQEVKPTMFGSLPRFYEKIHARIVADIHNLPTEKQAEFQRVLDLGREIDHCRSAQKPVPKELMTEYQTIAPGMQEFVRRYFGGKIKMLSSGGAVLPLEIAEFFSAVQLPILQAYGLTENLCTSLTRADNYRCGTVGQAMPGSEIKIAPDGEVLVRGQQMFSGYYKEPEKTAETFSDGWLLTGDLGEFTSDGFLKITGRKKELIITSTGKNIAPALIESLIKEHHLISQAMAYGDGKSYIVALITLNQMETEEYARRQGLEYENFAALTQHPQILALVTNIVDKTNARVSSTEAVKRFVVLPHDLSLEADEITPTMKVKRNVVMAKYREQLESLYY
jgi:long-chain acyl-CoA synthetase